MTMNNIVKLYPLLNLPAAIETTTNVYSEIALTLAAIFGIMSICFFIKHTKSKRNHY